MSVSAPPSLDQDPIDIIHRGKRSLVATNNDGMLDLFVLMHRQNHFTCYSRLAQFPLPSPRTSAMLTTHLSSLTCPFSPSINVASLHKNESMLVITANFPDQAVTDVDGTWYAFATTSGNVKIQLATSSDFATWTVIEKDALGTVISWVSTSNPAIWAPDVVQLTDRSFLMYFSGTTNTAGHGRTHCVGTATSDSVEGPYSSNSDTPLACQMDHGGAIDASGFRDTDGTLYIVYKIDGNAVGYGGTCGNTVEPIVRTPIMIQLVEANGTTRVGDPIQVLDRDLADGPLIEAPSMMKSSEGTYVLLYSSDCYATSLYDVRYATSKGLLADLLRVVLRCWRLGLWIDRSWWSLRQCGWRAYGVPRLSDVRQRRWDSYDVHCKDQCEWQSSARRSSYSDGT